MRSLSAGNYEWEVRYDGWRHRARDGYSEAEVFEIELP